MNRVVGHSIEQIKAAREVVMVANEKWDTKTQRESWLEEREDSW
jgi:hypothetical protein